MLSTNNLTRFTSTSNDDTKQHQLLNSLSAKICLTCKLQNRKSVTKLALEQYGVSRVTLLQTVKFVFFRVKLNIRWISFLFVFSNSCSCCWFFAVIVCLCNSSTEKAFILRIPVKFHQKHRYKRDEWMVGGLKKQRYLYCLHDCHWKSLVWLLIQKKKTEPHYFCQVDLLLYVFQK